MRSKLIIKKEERKGWQARIEQPGEVRKMEKEELMESLIRTAESFRDAGESERAWRLMLVASDVAVHEMRERTRDEALWRQRCVKLEEELEMNLHKQ